MNCGTDHRQTQMATHHKSLCEIISVESQFSSFGAQQDGHHPENHHHHHHDVHLDLLPG